MRHANSTAFAFCERLVYKRVVATAVSRMRTGMSHSDDHGQHYSIEALKRQTPSRERGGADYLGQNGHL